jgi:hypothetical protein
MSIPQLGGFLGISGILWLYGQAGGNYGPLLIWVPVAALAYVFSLRTHPDRPCWTCKGEGRHRGLIFDYAQRPCATCSGSGKHPRFGTRFVNQQARK